MRTTRLMTLFGLTMYCLTCSAIAQVKNAGQQRDSTQPGSKLPDSPTEDLFGKSDDPFSGASQGEGPFGQTSAGKGGGEGQSTPMDVEIDGIMLKPSRIFDFQVNVDSLTIAGFKASGSMGVMGGAGSMMEGGDGGMGSSGGGMMGMGMGGGGEGGMGMSGMGGMGGMSGGMGGGMAGPNYSIAQVRAYVFDDEKREGRTRIEVVTWGKKGNAAVGHPLEKLKLRQGKAKSTLAFTPASAKLVEDAIRLKIWKMDSIRDFKASGGKGDQAAEAEQLLKAILTEEYEGQIKRQQFELARLKSQLEKIHDEITRRQGAKDRVIDVQLGKILLEAQGIIGQNDQ